MASSEGRLFGYLLIGFFAGIVLFFKGFKKLKLKRLIENIPTSKIRSVAIGLVEVKGKIIKKDELLESPLSKEKCVYYKVEVEVLRRSRRSTYWQTVIKEEKNVRFYLKDDTGKILVDPKGAKLDIPVDFSYETNYIGSKLPQKVLEFSESKNLSVAGFFKQTYKFKEYYVKENESLYVLGNAGKSPEKSFSKVGAENLMIQKGNIYFISDSHEEGVLKSLTKQFRWMIYGGPALSVICFLGLVWMIKYL